MTPGPSATLDVAALAPGAGSGDAGPVVDALAGWLDDARPARLVIETSGSTGRPKRVLLTRDAVTASARASLRRLGLDGVPSVGVLALPPAYVAGVQVVVRSLLGGHRPLLAASAAADDLAAALDRAPAGVPVHTSLVGTQLHRLVADPAGLAVLRRCHTVLLGGGPVDATDRARAEEAGVRVVATYGASETAGGCVYDGVPLDGVALATAADGRIRIGGPTLFSGYEDDPGLTAATLVDGWYVTQDAGRLDEDGRLVVLGRVDDVVVTGGVKVPAPAVAARLRAHPGVGAVEVLGVPDEEWGQRLVALAVPAGPGGLPPLAELRDWVAAAHPRSWAPREVRVLDALPLLANGKVDRVALRARA